MYGNTAHFGGSSGMPLDTQVRSTISFMDMGADSQVQRAFQQRRNTINVSIGFDQQEDNLLKNQRVQRDPYSGDILLAPLLEQIRVLGIECNNCVITYWSQKDKTYVFVGKYPLPAETKIPEIDIAGQPTIQIKLRQQQGSPSGRQQRSVNRMASLSAQDTGVPNSGMTSAGKSMAARVQQGRQAAMEEEKGANQNVSTRSKRIAKDNKAPAKRGGRQAAAADDDGEDSQVSKTAICSTISTPSCVPHPKLLENWGIAVLCIRFIFTDLVDCMGRVRGKTKASARRRDQSKKSSRK